MKPGELGSPVFEGHRFTGCPEMGCLHRVILVELLPERPDEFDFANTGCPAGNRMHRFNIRIKTINYDGLSFHSTAEMTERRLFHA
jgi:hypothetical protein